MTIKLSRTQCPNFLCNSFDIVKIIKKYKLNCGIFTNGLLLDKERIKEIVENKLDYVVFSLQGIGKVHDEVVSVEGAYEKLIKNLELFEIEEKNITLIEWPELIKNKPTNRIDLFFKYAKDMKQRVLDIKLAGRLKKYDFKV